jgi:hypothetical protein
VVVVEVVVDVELVVVLVVSAIVVEVTATSVELAAVVAGGSVPTGSLSSLSASPTMAPRLVRPTRTPSV